VEGVRFQGSEVERITNRDTLVYRKMWMRLETLKPESAVQDKF
jgi:hypothetical protein